MAQAVSLSTVRLVVQSTLDNAADARLGHFSPPTNLAALRYWRDRSASAACNTATIAKPKPIAVCTNEPTKMSAIAIRAV